MGLVESEADSGRRSMTVWDGSQGIKKKGGKWG